MFDIGLGDDAAREHLARCFEIIRLIDRMDDDIPALPHEMPASGSELAALATEAPDGPIGLLEAIRVALMTARGTLDSIALSFTRDQGTHAIALQALTRAALISSGRVLFALAPTALAQRQQNVRVILSQESHSLVQGLDAFAKFQSLDGLRHDDDTAGSVRELDRSLRGGQRPQGEARTLNEMAAELTQVLSANFPDLGTTFSEHVEWVFHIYSGAAHGFAWPWEYYAAPGSLPGDFVADFGGVVPLAQLAFQTTLNRIHQPAEPRPSQPTT